MQLEEIKQMAMPSRHVIQKKDTQNTLIKYDLISFQSVESIPRLTIRNKAQQCYCAQIVALIIFIPLLRSRYDMTRYQINHSTLYLRAIPAHGVLAWWVAQVQCDWLDEEALSGPWRHGS